MSAGADQLAGPLLNSLEAEVRLENAKWLQDDSTAYHLTLTIDGWSNARMESVYSWNIIFPDRRVILLRADDLSSISHTGENLAGTSAMGSAKTCLLVAFCQARLCTAWQVQQCSIW